MTTLQIVASLMFGCGGIVFFALGTVILTALIMQRVADRRAWREEGIVNKWVCAVLGILLGGSGMAMAVLIWVYNIPVTTTGE